MNKAWYLHVRKCYSVFKVRAYQVTRMEFQKVLLSKKRRRHQLTYSVISLHVTEEPFM